MIVVWHLQDIAVHQSTRDSTACGLRCDELKRCIQRKEWNVHRYEGVLKDIHKDMAESIALLKELGV